MPDMHEGSIGSPLTGATRLRRGLWGRAIIQVEDDEGGWHDARTSDLRDIGFMASSARGRKRAQLPIEQRPPRDWNAGTDTRWAWE